MTPGKEMLAQLCDLAERIAQSAEQLGRPDLAEMAREAVRDENVLASTVPRIPVKTLQGKEFTIAEFDGRCPFCVYEARKSRLVDHGGMITCLGFWPYHDEKG